MRGDLAVITAKLVSIGTKRAEHHWVLIPGEIAVPTIRLAPQSILPVDVAGTPIEAQIAGIANGVGEHGPELASISHRGFQVRWDRHRHGNELATLGLTQLLKAFLEIRAKPLSGDVGFP